MMIQVMPYQVKALPKSAARLYEIALLIKELNECIATAQPTSSELPTPLQS